MPTWAGLIAHDPEDRELRIACGAALFNLRVALDPHGVTPVVTIEPGDLPDALAVIRRGSATVRSQRLKLASTALGSDPSMSALRETPRPSGLACRA